MIGIELNYTAAEINARLALAETAVQSNPTDIAGADAITNIVSLTQAEYDAIEAPSSTVLYVITE